MRRTILAILLACAAATALTAQNVDAPRVERASDVAALPVPVTSGDIGDRPYRVIGRVDTFVGKALWQGKPDQAKIYRELWERARRLGADAVIHANYGTPQHEFFKSWGGRQASGDAIQFVTQEDSAPKQR